METNQSIPKEFTEFLVWNRTKDEIYPYSFLDTEDSEFRIRINDFPEEPLYTLLKDGKALMSFDDWPNNWKIK